MLSSFSHFRLLCPWGCSRQKHWSGLLRPPPGDLPDPGIEPAPLTSSALAGGFLTTCATGEAHEKGWGGGVERLIKSLGVSLLPSKQQLPFSENTEPSQFCFKGTGSTGTCHANPSRPGPTPSSSCRVTGVGMAWQERQREGNPSEDTDSTGPRSRLYPDSPVPSELFPHL